MSQPKEKSCPTCFGEGFTYPLVEVQCQICKHGKKSRCTECGGIGWTRQMMPQRCEPCLGLGLLPTPPPPKEGATSK